MRISDWSSDVCSSDLLHEIEALDAPERTLLLHLPRPARLQPGPDLLRREELRRATELLQAIADDRRRGAVHPRAVDHPPAAIEEGPQPLGPRVPQAPFLADVQGDPGAPPDPRPPPPARRAATGARRP